MNAKILGLAILLLPLLIAGCAQQSPPPANGGNGNAAVEISNFAFSPASLTVAKGTTVTWTNKDSVQHSATSDNGKFDTGLIPQNQSASVTFNNSGTFNYHCTPHPQMKAKIIVQ